MVWKNGHEYFTSSGSCPICMVETTFVSQNEWLRDHFLCANCQSIPRERALMHVLRQWYPNWRELIIHESSPSSRGASLVLKNQCSRYIPSQFWADRTAGTDHAGIRCENLESLTFANESIDLHITQDVLEHVFDPAATFSEIARTLKHGGAHIFTVPLVMKAKPTQKRAFLCHTGIIEHILDPVYHGNPIDSKGSLVVHDWGYDITRHIFDACGLYTDTIIIDDLSKGIRAEYIEVLITRKH